MSAIFFRQLCSTQLYECGLPFYRTLIASCVSASGPSIKKCERTILTAHSHRRIYSFTESISSALSMSEMTPAPAPAREGEGEGDLLLTKTISFRPPPKMPSYVSNDGILNKCESMFLIGNHRAFLHQSRAKLTGFGGRKQLLLRKCQRVWTMKARKIGCSTNG